MKSTGSIKVSVTILLLKEYVVVDGKKHQILIDYIIGLVCDLFRKIYYS